MLKAVWAGALSWCRNQSPLCHFCGCFHRRLSYNCFITFQVQVTLLIYCLSWRNKLPVHYPINIKKRNHYCLGTWATLPCFFFGLGIIMLFFVWANLVTSTDVTAALAQDRSCSSTNSLHLLKLLWETESHFWALRANHSTFACLFFCSCVGTCGTNFAATHLIITSSVKMHWQNLQHTPVLSWILFIVQWRTARIAWQAFWTVLSFLLMEGRTQLCWSSTHSTPFEMTKPLVHFCFTHGFVLTSFPVNCDSFSCSFSQTETKLHPY